MAILEADLSRETLKLLAGKYKIYTAVPLYNRCIDAVLLGEGRLTTVEFKVKDWRRAVRQIRTHLLAADYSYLCMPKRQVPQELEQILMEMGVGLWLFDFNIKEIEEVLSPEPSPAQMTMLKEKMLKYLNSRESESDCTQTCHQVW